MKDYDKYLEQMVKRREEIKALVADLGVRAVAARYELSVQRVYQIAYPEKYKRKKS